MVGVRKRLMQSTAWLYWKVVEMIAIRMSMSYIVLVPGLKCKKSHLKCCRVGTLEMKMVPPLPLDAMIKLPPYFDFHISFNNQ